MRKLPRTAPDHAPWVAGRPAATENGAAAQGAGQPVPARQAEGWAVASKQFHTHWRAALTVVSLAGIHLQDLR
jgi:hypothetical protein